MYTSMIWAPNPEQLFRVFEVQNAFYGATLYRTYCDKIEYCNFQNSIVLILAKC